MSNPLQMIVRSFVAVCVALMTCAATALDIKEHSFKVAFVQMKDHPQGLSLERFADIVSKKSDGKMKVRSFAGGTLGGDAAVISSLQGGTIDMTLVATSLLGSQIKEFAMLDFPYLFNNFREVDAVLDGAVGKKLNDKLPEKGLIGLSYWDHGFRNMTNSRRPIAKLEDFQGLKIRVLQLPLYVDMFTALGANAVPMPYPELYTGLETKTVDGQESTLDPVVQQDRLGPALPRRAQDPAGRGRGDAALRAQALARRRREVARDTQGEEPDRDGIPRPVRCTDARTAEAGRRQVLEGGR